jgi:hypothetical protein
MHPRAHAYPSPLALPLSFHGPDQLVAQQILRHLLEALNRTGTMTLSKRDATRKIAFILITQVLHDLMTR